jgi:SAM-dependent methyltransferase
VRCEGLVLIAGFDPALAGATARLVRSDGVEVELSVHRWRDPAAGEDRWLLDRCAGSTLDLGCGPGRLVEALLARGLPALGVDVSTVAEAACRRRRVPMVRRDVFAPLPAEGQWDHALLADGNIGIGGGTVLVETGGRPEELWRGTARALRPRRAPGHSPGSPRTPACTGPRATRGCAASWSSRPPHR